MSAVPERTLNWLYSVLTSVRQTPSRFAIWTNMARRAGIPRCKPNLLGRCEHALPLQLPQTTNGSLQYAITSFCQLQAVTILITSHCRRVGASKLTELANSIRERQFRFTAASLWHTSSLVSRRDVPVSDSDMATSYIPIRGSHGLCNSCAGHGARPG